jgi:hypothetical protein
MQPCGKMIYRDGNWLVSSIHKRHVERLVGPEIVRELSTNSDLQITLTLTPYELPYNPHSSQATHGYPRALSYCLLWHWVAD